MNAKNKKLLAIVGVAAVLLIVIVFLCPCSAKAVSRPGRTRPLPPRMLQRRM